MRDIFQIKAYVIAYLKIRHMGSKGFVSDIRYVYSYKSSFYS